MENLPLNHRTRWTDNEFMTLMIEIKKNLDLNTIANNHKRTIGAIKYKLIRYAISLSEEDQNLKIEDLCNITKLSKEDLIKGFEKLNYTFFENEDTESNYSEESNYTNKTNHTIHNNISNEKYTELENNLKKINLKVSIIYGCLFLLITYKFANFIKDNTSSNTLMLFNYKDYLRNF